ncbi:MAG: hypothetical protein GY875_03110 [Gammaproteobacteria bacterium]|nr:hypothetical protein [Gammaproteobacteria bacterium]
MTGLPFTDPVATPAVRTPKLKISQQQDSGGGLGGLAGTAAALLGGEQGADPWQAYLMMMRLTLGSGNHVGHAILHVMDGDAAPEANLGDKLDIALSFDDDAETPIFTGSIQKIEATVAGYRRLTVTSPLLALSQKRINTSFEEQSADDILQALLAETDVEAGNIASGGQYPFYVVSDRRSLLDHIQRLCAQQNWLCFCGPDGKLNAQSVAAADAAKSFAYGSDIIEMEHGTRLAALSGLKVIGGGAASSNGADAWNWLTKDPKALSETGEPGRVVAMRALRDAQAAQSFGESLVAQDAQQTSYLRLLTSAAPEVLPGNAFSVEGVPTGTTDGTYVAERVVISFDRSQGFQSRIEGFNRDAVSAGALGAPGGLL